MIDSLPDLRGPGVLQCVCVTERVCVCVSIWFIDIRETYNAHACLLSVCVSCWWQKIRTFLKLHAHRFSVLFLWGPSPTWFLPCSLAFVPTLPTNNINSITWSWNTGLFLALNVHLKHLKLIKHFSASTKAQNLGCVLIVYTLSWLI